MLSCLFFIFILPNVLSLNNEIDLTSQSLLVYFDKLHDSKLEFNVSDFIENKIDLSKFCQQRTFNFTVYYRILYFRFCNESVDSFEDFCADLNEYYSNDTTENVRQKLQSTGKEANIFDPGSLDVQLWLAHHACGYVKDYYDQKRSLTANDTTKTENKVPKFTEWLIHTVPFTSLVACGFTQKSFDEIQPSTSTCLPTNYKAAIFSIMVTDGIILILTTLANIIILIINPKLNIAKTPHGYLRMSLAVSDLLIGIVIAGGINSTFVTYFTLHPFSEENTKTITRHYFSETYINVFGFFTILSFSVSIFTLVAISLDRFVAIYKPIFYTIHIGKMKCYGRVGIFVIWTCSFFLAVSPLLIPGMKYVSSGVGIIVAPGFGLPYGICLGTSLLAVWILNIALYLSVKFRPAVGERITQVSVSNLSEASTHFNQTKNTRLIWIPISVSNSKKTQTNISTSFDNILAPQQESKNSICPRKKLEMSLAITVRYIVLAFTIALLPITISIFTGGLLTLEPSSQSFNPLAKAVWTTFSYIASRILFSNSFVNCFIYSYRSSDFRRNLKKLLCI